MAVITTPIGTGLVSEKPDGLVSEKPDGEMPEGPVAGDPLTQAVVDRIGDGLATVLVGPDQEEWVFPAHLLPPEATEGSTLILEGTGRNFHVIGIGAGRDGVEERLARTLNKRRPIVLPLPRREIPVLVPQIELGDRPSRLIRDLHRRDAR